VGENNKLANEITGLRNTIQEPAESRTGLLEIVDYIKAEKETLP